MSTTKHSDEMNTVGRNLSDEQVTSQTTDDAHRIQTQPRLT